MRYIVNKTSVASVQLGKPLDLKLSFVSPPRQGIGLKKDGGVTKIAITFEPLVRFQFFKGQNCSKFDFLFKNYHETTRQREPRGDFGQNGVYWNYFSKI